jgi:putative transposase
VAERDVPEALRYDNGPEFTSRHFLAWGIEKRRKRSRCCTSGRDGPVQNAYVESFHGKLRDECLNAIWFENLFEARAKIGDWKEEYNDERPHSSLGYLAPREFARRMVS